jgi:hypothetical protein
MSGSAECRNQPPRGKRAHHPILIGLTARSPERVRMNRAFLLTKTYMDAGDSFKVVYPRLSEDGKSCVYESATNDTAQRG